MNNRLDTWISKVKSNENALKSEQKTHNTQQKKFFPRSKSKKSQIGPHAPKQRLRAIPLGGLNEVGRNCMCLEYGNDIILIDVGVQFPQEGMLGVRFVLPDTRYVEQKKNNIRAVIITHGHLDHIGGLAHVLPKLGYPPVYAPPLAVGLIQKQLREYKLLDKIKIHKINPYTDVLRFGAFTVEYFHVNHSIPDCNGLYIQTPTAKVVHTGDFKFDFTPADGVQTDYARIAEIGKRGVDAVFADSTNAQKAGYCVSEKVVAETLERIIRETPRGRLFITSFASLIGRWQQVIRFAQKYDRKIYVTGRSLLENLKIATDLGFIKIPQGVIHKVTTRIHDTPPHKQLIISTGCQGEENAAISRIVRGDHSIMKVEKGDTVVFSASPIPGNERQTINVINELYKIGAKVITRDHLNVHTSGHAHQGDLKLMYSLLKPKNIIPVHGEYHMRADHAKMVHHDLGFQPTNIALIGNGDILEIEGGEIHKSREKASGEHIFVDGNMRGDVGPEIQKDRKALMNGGLVSFLFEVDRDTKKLKHPPRIQSLGFLYAHEKEVATKIKKEAMDLVHQVLQKHDDPVEKRQEIEHEVSKKLPGKITQLTDREPRVLVSVVIH